MTVLDVVCMIIISACTFAIGYCVALLKINKAIQKTISHAELMDNEFYRGSIWAIEYLLWTLSNRKS